jgi:hypothetical protein
MVSDRAGRIANRPAELMKSSAGRRTAPGGYATSPLLLVPALDPRLLQQLAVLLLGHTLAALLDD